MRTSDVFSRFTEFESIQNEVRGHIDAIHELMSRIRRAAGGGRGPGRPAGRRPGRPRGRRPGRPAGRPAAAKRGRPAGGRRAKRGALREALHKILAGGKSMKPADIVRALPGVGFKNASNPRVLYTSVYLALKKDKSMKKTAEGFQLKGGKAAKAS
jgi:hypothetical protein